MTSLSWEKEWVSGTAKFVEVENISRRYSVDPQADAFVDWSLKFIRELLATRDEELVKKLEGMIGKQVCRNPACGKESHDCENTVRNEALREALSAIRGGKV